MGRGGEYAALRTHSDQPGSRGPAALRQMPRAYNACADRANGRPGLRYAHLPVHRLRSRANRQDQIQAMTLYQPATAASNALVRPPCTKCDTPTLLMGIESGKPGYDLNPFECPKC